AAGRRSWSAAGGWGRSSGTCEVGGGGAAGRGLPAADEVLPVLVGDVDLARVVAAVGRAPGERSGPGRDLPVPVRVTQDPARDPDDDPAEAGVREAPVGEPLVEVRELPGEGVLDVAEQHVD